MKRVLVALPIAALVFMTMGVSTAFAAPPPPTTWVVDDDGLAVVGDCNGSLLVFSDIPSAVTAASSGDTILVCPGNYNDGQIIVDKTLTIKGSYAGTSAQSCVSRSVPGQGESRVFGSAGPGGGGTPTGAFWLQADNITIDGFLIEDNTGPGIQTNNDHSGYLIRNNLIRNNVMGLYLQANPDGTAARTKVHYNCFQSNNVGASAGNGSGIYTDAGLRHTTIFSNTFRHNENAGIILIGDQSSMSTRLKNVNVVSNTSIDDKTFLAVFGGSGIFVQDNRVGNDGQGFGNDGSAIFIGADANAVTMVGNRIDSAHFAGIAIHDSADNIYVARNRISHTDRGIDVETGAKGAVLARRNTITNVNEYGLYLRLGTSENQVANNVVSGSGVSDCQDATSGGPGTAGTDNHWVNNVGTTSNPAGLCAP